MQINCSTANGGGVPRARLYAGLGELIRAFPVFKTSKVLGFCLRFGLGQRFGFSGTGADDPSSKSHSQGFFFCEDRALRLRLFGTVRNGH